MTLTPEDRARAMIERNAHIPSAEVLQDIADTEAEIAQVILLAPMLGEADRERHLAVNEDRRAFIVELRHLLAIRTASEL